ncbi:MAG: hypothetical protein JNL34_15125 [Anaerolineae bacterium]|nr:hypothetical protein [Anaerolineae bacterium]
MVDQPDFENMSPEEIMAWMETLAKRQGATEGFTTDADLDIPEIDPDTVVIDEPGYVPYSESRASSPADDTVVSMPVVPAPQVRPPAPPPATPPPPAAVPPVRPVVPPVPRPVTPAWSAPRAAEPPQPKPAPEPQGSLAWLESLAQQTEDSLFNLDLSGLGDDTPEPAESDPAAWLQAMAATPDLESVSANSQAADDDDSESLRWLESLARRQGAPSDELTTSADFDVSAFKGEPEAPAYTPFSFNTAPAPRSSAKAADPSDFLGSLAAAEGYDEAGVLATRVPEVPVSEPDGAEITEIKRAISEGRVTPEQMHTFFEHQVDIAETLPPGPDELGLEEEEDLPVPADLPDWLLEQVQVDQPPAPPAPPPGTPPLESLFDQPVPAIPDWLQEDDSGAADALQGIFAGAEPESSDASEPLNIDMTDPWVEALEHEHTEGMAPVDSPPDWYLQNISDPDRLAAVEVAGPVLNNEPLPPETELPPGEPQPVPEWMATAAPAEAEAAGYDSTGDVPEWLAELDNVVTSSEIPAWLNEPVDFSADDGLPFELEEAPPTPEFVIDAPSVPAEPVSAPGYVEAPPPALISARQRRQSGDIAGALEEYEALIRSSTSLQDCVDDLAHVAHLERNNPVVFRVLGDGYMRLGKLQRALDTYREALNHL